jgi:hypothetical protein
MRGQTLSNSCNVVGILELISLEFKTNSKSGAINGKQGKAEEGLYGGQAVKEVISAAERSVRHLRTRLRKEAKHQHAPERAAKSVAGATVTITATATATGTAATNHQASLNQEDGSMR